MRIIIDGYNLIRQSDRLRAHDRRSLEAGRNALIQLLIPFRRERQHGITVVFDAWDAGGPVEERDRQSGIDIIYSRRGRKADDVIKEIIARGTGEETLVVTSDREVADYVTRRGATVVPSPAFESVVFRFNIGAASDVKEEASSEGDSGFQKGTKKKGPSRRLSRNQRDMQRKIRKL